MSAEDDYLILNRLVKPQGLIIDVGAHRGQSALSFSAIKPDWNIVSFEPNPHCKIGLRLVKFLLGKKYHLWSIGLSNAEDELSYYEPIVGLLKVSAEGTFERSNLDNEAIKRIGSQFDIRERRFKVAPLDKFGLAPDVVKIDVQGSEHKVLEGMKETIKRCFPLIIVEKNEKNLHKVLEYLNEFKYKAYIREPQMNLCREFNGAESSTVANVIFVSQNSSSYLKQLLENLS